MTARRTPGTLQYAVLIACGVAVAAWATAPVAGSEAAFPPAVGTFQSRELARLHAAHGAVRARLSAEDRALLSRLATLVSRRMLMRGVERDRLKEAKDSISELVPGLTDHERSVIATYVLDELAATNAFGEMQMSFNLQYLQLQSQIQHENRSYTAISNIMKIKHDTVKNSISNIR
jgi:hypothetical protein